MKCKTVLAYLFCGGLLFFGSDASARDFQLWSLAKAARPMNESWTAKAQFSARFRDHASRVFQYYGELSFARKLPCNWEIEPGYRHQWSRAEDGWDEEQVPLVAIKKKQVFGNLTVVHRSRFEYRCQKKNWRFRQRLTCELPWTLTPLCLMPYAYEEAFFTEGSGYVQNRVFGGFSKSLGDRGELSIGYLLREDRKERKWIPTDVLYLTGGVKF